MKNFINLDNWSKTDLENLLDSAQSMKAELKAGKVHHKLSNKNIGMIFDKSSLRTRVSFEVGINQLGAHAIVLGSSAGKLGEREPIADFARVASRYVDGLIVRTYEEEKLIELEKYSTIPVINALSDDSHPCQSMADALTLKEHWGTFDNKTLAYIGDSNNVTRSLVRMAMKLDLKMHVISPEDYQFEPEELKFWQDQGIKFFTDPKEGVKGVDSLYTDVWTSMGQEKEKEKRLIDFQGFIIDNNLMACAADDVKVLHCLPAHRGEEISDEVIESKNSIVFDQAENRLHIQKAIMIACFS
jgi:ornithine carbamoyltransferase